MLRTVRGEEKEEEENVARSNFVANSNKLIPSSSSSAVASSSRKLVLLALITFATENNRPVVYQNQVEISVKLIREEKTQLFENKLKKNVNNK